MYLWGKAQNDQNFITLGKISEQEKLEIIKLGFQLNQEGKIFLKKYQIKYDTIRKAKLYRQFGS